VTRCLRVCQVSTVEKRRPASIIQALPKMNRVKPDRKNVTATPIQDSLTWFFRPRRISGLRPGSWVEKIQASLSVALCGRARSSFGTGGATLASSLAPGFIVQCPSNSAPSCTTKTGVVRLPTTLAPG
jgi:hypothetical protein